VPERRRGGAHWPVGGSMSDRSREQEVSRLVAVSVAVGSPVIDSLLKDCSEPSSSEELSWQKWFGQLAEIPWVNTEDVCSRRVPCDPQPIYRINWSQGLRTDRSRCRTFIKDRLAGLIAIFT